MKKPNLNKENIEKCPICNALCKRVFKNFPGYLEGTYFDIFLCKICDSQFILSKNYNKKIYQSIYSHKETPGYRAYYDYSVNIKKQNVPLLYLSKKEPGYYPVWEFMNKNRKKSLKILEVGCSYGYLSYAIKKMGHDILGIDISEKAIEFARSNFGRYYKSTSMEKFNSSKKFDVIIAIEILEHLKDPKMFLRKCKKHLKKNGKIIIATPNKNSRLKNPFWCSDLPPVHMFGFGKKSLLYLSRIEGFECEFVNFSNYYSSKENKLIRLAESRNKNSLPTPRLTNENKPIQENKTKIPNWILNFILWPPINYVSHLISKLTSYECTTLGAILTKKD